MVAGSEILDDAKFSLEKTIDVGEPNESQSNEGRQGNVSHCSRFFLPLLMIVQPVKSCTGI